MKVPYKWLQLYFDKTLPGPVEIARLFTMHAFELESIEGAGEDSVFDFKILPNRAHDCLGIDGIARELSVLSGIPLKQEERGKIQETSTEHKLKISIEDNKLCPRYMGRIMENVKIGESPSWMKERLEAIGQRSINNVVDVTNYVMFATGQPMHAFDLDKLASEGNQVEIIVRTAKAGEKLITLDAKDIALDRTMLVIADKEKPVALAGIKGGKWAEVDSSTKHIILESANFEPTSTRKTSQKVGIRTDSEKRFENEITPEFAGKAMEIATAIFSQFASSDDTKIGEVVDVYPRKRRPYHIGVSSNEVNNILGTKMTETEVGNILDKLSFEHEIVENPIESVLEMSQKLIGATYDIGASVLYDAPNAFDCSGLMAYLFAGVGIKIPRLAIDQYVWTERIDKDNVRAGDLVFSNTGSSSLRYESVEFLPKTKVPGGVSHVGILLDKETVLHASYTKEKVVIEKLADSDRFKNITGFGRVAGGDERRITVIIPIERLDFNPSFRAFLSAGNKEDLIEEIGRVHGYEDIPSVIPEKVSVRPAVNEKLDKANKIREALAEQGFSEVMTYAFVGESVFPDVKQIEIANPLSSDKKFLRDNLQEGIGRALISNMRNAALLGYLGGREIKIFEIGTVFKEEGEEIKVAVGKMKVTPILSKSMVGSTNDIKEYTLDEAYKEFVKPESGSSEMADSKPVRYKPISQYPFALRDIAIFVPSGTDESEVKKIIESEVGELLVRNDLFDKFEKDGKISYAFHLVFQSYEKTLSDKELDEIMEKITKTLNGNSSWQVR